MNVAVIGAGYVDLVAGICFAESGNEVICVDICESFLKQRHEVLCMDNYSTGAKQNIGAFLKNPHFRFIDHNVSR